MKEVIKINVVGTLGSSVFQNFGLIAVMIILVSEWKKGIILDNGKSVAMLSMIYLVFFSVNILFYFGLTNLQNFLAIVRRLSSVFEMQEF